ARLKDAAGLACAAALGGTAPRADVPAPRADVPARAAGASAAIVSASAAAASAAATAATAPMPPPSKCKASARPPDELVKAFVRESAVAYVSRARFAGREHATSERTWRRRLEGEAASRTEAAYLVAQHLERDLELVARDHAHDDKYAPCVYCFS